MNVFHATLAAMWGVVIAKKITGDIDTSWWWVSAPLWMPIAVPVALFIVIFICTFPIHLARNLRTA